MAGVRTYMDRHAWQNTTLGDLLSELERESGRDLSAWSKEWLETAGCNTLRPAFAVGPDGSYTEFAVAQEAPERLPHAALAPNRRRPVRPTPATGSCCATASSWTSSAR